MARTTPRKLGLRFKPGVSVRAGVAPPPSSGIGIQQFVGGIVDVPTELVTLGTRHYCPADALLHFDGGDGSAVYVDSGPGFFDPTGTAAGRVVTAFGGALQSSTQAKFGVSSLQLDGVDDYVEVAVTATGLPFVARWPDLYATVFSTTRQWCMGAWVYLTAAGTHCIASAGPTSLIYWELIVNTTTNTIQLRTVLAGVPTVRVSTTTTPVSLNTWHRIDVESFVGSDRIYFNGAIVATLAHATVATLVLAPALRFGANVGGTVFMTGFMDDAYWRNGAPYNGVAFTPETVALAA